MEIVFSPESEGVDQFAWSAPRRRASHVAVAPTPPRPLIELLQRLAIAGLQATPPEPGPQETIITCDGGLTVVPLRDASRRPPTPKDAELRLSGAPVRLHDAEAEAEAEAQRLLYRTANRRVELEGAPSVPLVMRSPQLELTGERFWMSELTATGGFTGPGTLTLPDATSTRAADDPDTSAGSRSDDGGDLTIAWQDTLDLDFAEIGGGGMNVGRLRSARFDGEVDVRSTELLMDAEQLTVAFAEDAAGEADIESIVAEQARLRDPDDRGAIECDHLDLALEPGVDGRATPRRLVATGNVAASDEEQVMWAERLEVTFLDDPSSAEASSTRTLDWTGGGRVDTVLATGGVLVLTADGARAFADRFEADARRESGALLGDEVLVAREGLLMERGTRVEFDRASETARWMGPGIARVFPEPVIGDERRPLERPIVPDDAPNAEMTASWASSMRFDSGFNDGAGKIDLHGDVNVVTIEPDREHGTLEGQHLTVELTESAPSADQLAEVPEAADTDPLSNRRAIKRFVARHQAKLERRVWSAGDPDVRPNVFFVAGEYIEYDDDPVEAMVLGDGTLLIRDLTPGAGGAGAANRPFSGKGTTMFLFSERLQMHEIEQDQFRIEMVGNVQVSHQDLDGRTAAATGQRFNAEMTRVGTPPESAAGGSMDLQRLEGRGSVYIRTPERRVECDEFDYDVGAGLAQLRAAPGRMVTILSPTGEQVDASSVEWDMGRDIIRVRDASGTTRRAP
jgi:hypothetical protein